MVSEALYGDSQADDIEIDEKYFGKDEFDGPYSSGSHWNVLERYVDISTELGESLTTYVQAMDETAAEYQARMAFVNGELECEGTQIVYICAYRA